MILSFPAESVWCNNLVIINLQEFSWKTTSANKINQKLPIFFCVQIQKYKTLVREGGVSLPCSKEPQQCCEGVTDGATSTL